MRNTKLKAELFGYLLGDGWISTRNLNCGFSGDLESLQIIKDDLKKIFNGNIGAANIKTYKTKSEAYGISGETNRFICNKKVAEMFVSLGAPIGKRVEQDIKIPDWILNGNKEIKSSFISGIYAAEGYTPRFQKNGKTLKAIGFNMSKRSFCDKDLFINQYSKILNDLGIDFNVKIKNTFTCDYNNKIEFIFSNSNENIEKVTRIIKPRYSKEKYNLFKQINLYYNKKIECLNKLEEAYEYTFNNPDKYPKEIAKKFNITKRQVECWRTRKTGFRIPNTFPTFNDFISANPCGPL